jgi:hypothetical protein
MDQARRQLFIYSVYHDVLPSSSSNFSYFISILAKCTFVYHASVSALRTTTVKITLFFFFILVTPTLLLLLTITTKQEAPHLIGQKVRAFSAFTMRPSVSTQDTIMSICIWDYKYVLSLLYTVRKSPVLFLRIKWHTEKRIYFRWTTRTMILVFQVM